MKADIGAAPKKPTLPAPINLLWTGGWDSTFRLLQATICDTSLVQPHYVIDPNRRSLHCELSAMASIKDAVADQFSGARARILPTLLYERYEIPENDAITASHRSLLSDSYIGYQYDWLARLAVWQQIPRLELAVHRDDRAHRFVKGLAAGEPSVAADSPHPAAILFQNFVFPILNVTKLDMASIARANQFSDILEKTWFCATPDTQLRPCGSCGPCRYTIKEGLPRRIPAANRVKARVLRVYAGIGRRIRTRTLGRKNSPLRSSSNRPA